MWQLVKLVLILVMIAFVAVVLAVAVAWLVDAVSATAPAWIAGGAAGGMTAWLHFHDRWRRWRSAGIGEPFTASLSEPFSGERCFEGFSEPCSQGFSERCSQGSSESCFESFSESCSEGSSERCCESFSERWPEGPRGLPRLDRGEIERALRPALAAWVGAVSAAAVALIGIEFNLPESAPARFSQDVVAVALAVALARRLLPYLLRLYIWRAELWLRR